MGGANSVDRPGTHLNPQANVHTNPIVRSSKSSLSGEVVAEEANTKVREVSSAPSKVDNDRSIATTAANSKSKQGDQFQERAVRYTTWSVTIGRIYVRTTAMRPKNVKIRSFNAQMIKSDFNVKLLEVLKLKGLKLEIQLLFCLFLSSLASNQLHYVQY